MPFTFNLEDYLARVGLPNAPSADEDGLQALHEAQFMTIAFENFDIQLGRGINLDPAHLVAKLVNRRRGGYCFELNGLMLMVLRALGYQARPLLARVHLGPGSSGRTHQLSLVGIAGRSWLIDVGFGAGGLRCPMPLEDGYTAEGPGWSFRLQNREPLGFMMQSLEDGAWKDSYSFDLAHVTEGDIAVGNHFTSTAPASHFVTSRIASLPLAVGRVSLRNHTLTQLGSNGKTTREVAAGAPYLEELAATFGIELDAQYERLRGLPAEH